MTRRGKIQSGGVGGDPRRWERGFSPRLARRSGSLWEAFWLDFACCDSLLRCKDEDDNDSSYTTINQTSYSTFISSSPITTTTTSEEHTILHKKKSCLIFKPKPYDEKAIARVMEILKKIFFDCVQYFSAINTQDDERRILFMAS